MSVHVREPALDDVIRLPSSALDATGAVLVLDAENRLESIQVSVLRRVGDDVLVRGPVEGRDVVEARSPLLGAGIAVKPLRPGADETAQGMEPGPSGVRPGEGARAGAAGRAAGAGAHDRTP